MANGYNYNSVVCFDNGTRVWYERMRYIVNELGRLQCEYIKLQKLRDDILGSW